MFSFRQRSWEGFSEITYIQVVHILAAYHLVKEVKQQNFNDIIYFTTILCLSYLYVGWLALMLSQEKLVHQRNFDFGATWVPPPLNLKSALLGYSS